MPQRRLHVAFVSAELTPYAKTGGLADISAALPKALAKAGHKVTVFLPRYGAIPYPPGEFAGSLHVPVDDVHRSAGFYRKPLARGLTVVFVEHPPFFERPFLYGTPDGGEYGDSPLRFAFFSRAAIEYFRARGERPDVFHANDWHTGLLPVYLKSFYSADPTLHRLPTVFTIHNIAYQGNFGRETVDVLGLPWHLGRDALAYDGGISYLKGGILFSEALNAVSPQYAREIQTPEMAYGFDPIVRSRAADLVGILNGVDYEEWDPRADPHIAKPYSPKDLSGKAACKADLLRTFGLPAEPDLPVVGIVSRLVHQKGFDIVVSAWYDLIQRPLRMVVLGTGDPGVQDGFRALAARAPDRFAVRFAYDEALAHKVEAGADMFLMPSRFEPCGLTQMYSLRYGTVPVVRATGGLVDTVEPWDPATGRGTGFRFDHPDGTGMMWALDQAVRAYQDREGWERLMKNGMAKDFSWTRSAREYVDLYRRAIAMV
jgi:starch synthase